MSWPTTDAPRGNFVTARLTDDEQQDLLDFMQDTGLEKSASLRLALDEMISRHKRKQKRAAQKRAAQKRAAQKQQVGGV